MEKAMNPQSVTRPQAKVSFMPEIVGSHVSRIGWIRTILGGLSMYTCIPFLIMTQISATVVLYQWLLRPLLNGPMVRWRDHVILDRHRITNLHPFDKFNCLFCGYANGLCTMMNTELDHLAGLSVLPGPFRRALVTTLLLIYVPFMLVLETAVQIIYNLMVSVPLGMRRTSIRTVQQLLAEQNYAGQYGVVSKWLLRLNKNTWQRFSLALEQIESSWCPLTHYERREGIVYPTHHANFFGPDELEKMYKKLATEGTVSPRKPLY